jgi:hypothetical protein
MEEILPGVHHWTARHPNIGVDVDSYYVAGAQTAIDPLLPEGATPGNLPGEVRQVVLSIGLHTRSARDFGVPIRVPREGLHRFEGSDIAVEPFADGDDLAPGIRARRLGTIAPDDYVLHIATRDGVIAFADALINYGGIGFVPDSLIGDDAEGVKSATLDELDRLLVEEVFDAVLFAHGAPIPTGGRKALEEFLAEQRG